MTSRAATECDLDTVLTHGSHRVHAAVQQDRSACSAHNGPRAAAARAASAARCTAATAAARSAAAAPVGAAVAPQAGRPREARHMAEGLAPKGLRRHRPAGLRGPAGASAGTAAAGASAAAAAAGVAAAVQAPRRPGHIQQHLIRSWQGQTGVLAISGRQTRERRQAEARDRWTTLETWMQRNGELCTVNTPVLAPHTT